MFLRKKKGIAPNPHAIAVRSEYTKIIATWFQSILCIMFKKVRELKVIYILREIFYGSIMYDNSFWCEKFYFTISTMSISIYFTITTNYTMTRSSRYIRICSTNTSNNTWSGS
jgi:hypothetical protein